MNPNNNHWSFIMIKFQTHVVNTNKIEVKMFDSLIPKDVEAYVKWE